MFPYQELHQLLELDIVNSVNEDYLDPRTFTGPRRLRAIRASMLLGSFYKKLQPGGVTQNAADAALEKFLGINDSISDTFRFAGESEWDSTFWDYFRDSMRKSLTTHDESFDVDYIGSKLAAGPGASCGCDNESFYTKLFASRITMTHPILLALYRAAICETGFWAQAELARHERFGEQVISGNRLFFVEKTTEIARTCCTEPLVNMVLQKALGGYLEDVLQRSFGISLKTQPDNNRALARLGSVDGSFATIDLASASDSISWSLCQQIIPENLLGFFRMARCPTTTLPSGKEVTLRMISTMGNGFTFPLQTLIFACVVRSVYSMMGLHSSDPSKHFGVFGDDIVVRREAYHCVIKYLEMLGFKVNVTKSFGDGTFRESCGHDYDSGAFVRGVYIRSLETVSDVYSAINRLNRWSAVSGIPLPRTVQFLYGSLKRKPLLVPFSESLDAGVQVPFKLSHPIVTDDYWFAYKAARPRQRTRKVPETLQECRDLGYSFYNPDGFAASALGGFARSGWTPITERSILARELHLNASSARFVLRVVGGRTAYKVVRSSIPYWDWLGPEVMDLDPSLVDPEIGGNPRHFSFKRWEAHVAINLGVSQG